MIWDAFWLSLRVTALASLIILVVGLGLALLLARKRFRGKLLLELIITLPLILPPSVLGYYLLVVLGRRNPLLEWLDVTLVFTWWAAVIAAAVVGLPLMVITARSAIAAVDAEIENAARMDGASDWQLLMYIVLPMARSGILAGLVLGSARALGEFGATLMVAGNIPGRTQTMSMAIYDAVQNREYHQAMLMVLLMTSVAFVGLWLAYRLNPATEEGNGRVRVLSRRRRG